MNDNASPLSIKEQIEVLEAAKKVLVELSTDSESIGLCYTIKLIIYYKHNCLYNLVSKHGAHEAIPSLNFRNAVLSGTVNEDADPTWFWWSTKIEKGGITNRLAFLDYLINNLKNEDHE